MSAIASDSAARVRPPRTPKCTRCRNHGVLVPVRGHSGNCGWKLCNCPKCALITERHKILAAHKVLRKPGSEEQAPEDGREKVGTPERTENSVLSLSTDLKRKKTSPPRISAFESVKRNAASMLTGPPMYSSEYAPTLDYFERETTRMYLGCSPIYHYPAFPVGLPSPGFGSTLIPPTNTTPPVIPLRGLRPCYPFQDGRGDFRPSYYPPIPQYIPPGYLSGLHYMPPSMPLNVSFMAEPKKILSGQAVPDSQSLRIASERSETPTRGKST
ncbi:doublesex- and mab-3-related transcription factor B1 [Anomaloglossus baeobatrachus]|uniref:doublesex- and mab-3-related transcription factor B1 n=1 Tax=Anomaloglossus baeobatrachus TaxID=238106 RepID=UPI003F509CB0